MGALDPPRTGRMMSHEGSVLECLLGRVCGDAVLGNGPFSTCVQDVQWKRTC